MNTEDIRAYLSPLRQWFVAQMAQMWGGDKFEDRALSVDGAVFLSEHILEMKPAIVVELGSGFSTIALSVACGIAGSKLISADHDAKWQSDVLSLIKSEELAPSDGVSLMAEPKFVSVVQAKEDKSLIGQVDLVLVDHGPTMETRVADIPWVVSILKRHGYVAFDDFRDKTRYEGRVRSTLTLKNLPVSLKRVAGVEGDDRWLGFGRRWK